MFTRPFAIVPCASYLSRVAFSFGCDLYPRSRTDGKTSRSTPRWDEMERKRPQKSGVTVRVARRDVCGARLGCARVGQPFFPAFPDSHVAAPKSFSSFAGYIVVHRKPARTAACTSDAYEAYSLHAVIGRDARGWLEPRRWCRSHQSRYACFASGACIFGDENFFSARRNVFVSYADSTDFGVGRAPRRDTPG